MRRRARARPRHTSATERDRDGRAGGLETIVREKKDRQNLKQSVAIAC